ncbi:hypothetical protein N7491_003073 [Penicillium cf. griseofulvum]|uniref:Uncharacterized protein n=1 Tax=Penicillium cf. griseofulvum TaxID=2972120 RepID=A0A9W9MRW8_9EURO|nr:hypothetical protein N7472_002756 [Penicillium cf. griseofulvum]KAJ5440667.1 hypothetical protein N7491_003073 [Penicillium cf. griseofulvum]
MMTTWEPPHQPAICEVTGENIATTSQAMGLTVLPSTETIVFPHDTLLIAATSVWTRTNQTGRR